MEMILAVDSLCHLASEVRQLRDEALKPWIEANGEIIIGEDKWFVGPNKKEKDRDVGATFDCLHDLAGSDHAAFVSLLSTNAFKPGAVKRFLKDKSVPDMYEVLFDVTVEMDVQTKRPKKTVQRINEQFVS